MESGKNYIHGSAAPKIEYDVYEENKVLKAKKTQRSNNKAKLKMVFAIFLVFIAGSAVMLRYTMITQINYSIDSRNKEYARISNENAKLEIAIQQEMDLVKVKEIAESKLGMHKPDKYQIVYVNIPRENLSIVSEKYKEKSSGEEVLKSVLNKLEELVALLY
ncbi:hypothetical protein DFR58_11057 [Anaerobacterium chartisolvens]|uniref:Cell division protein FtsL n=1 Tax=Anaerobacterium chartisolvens TaxID=1297424 RepID=A0A369BA51_9FIRM|nr:cell division protein FtsL [Anaerobacterium chartisolvens]RCX16564.1 hypothetical protein DFR58_11057 [Anaerobacterium chartisolvens]